MRLAAEECSQVNAHGDGGDQDNGGGHGTASDVSVDGCVALHYVHAGGVCRGCVYGHALAARANARVHGAR